MAISLLQHLKVFKEHESGENVYIQTTGCKEAAHRKVLWVFFTSPSRKMTMIILNLETGCQTAVTDRNNDT